MASKPNFKRRSTARLLSDWAAIMRELRRRGAIRSENNPTGDLVEALVAEFYGVEPEANSTAGRIQHTHQRLATTDHPG